MSYVVKDDDGIERERDEEKKYIYTFMRAYTETQESRVIVIVHYVELMKFKMNTIITCYTRLPRFK